MKRSLLLATSLTVLVGSYLFVRSQETHKPPMPIETISYFRFDTETEKLTIVTDNGERYIVDAPNEIVEVWPKGAADAEIRRFDGSQEQNTNEKLFLYSHVGRLWNYSLQVVAWARASKGKLPNLDRLVQGD